MTSRQQEEESCSRQTEAQKSRVEKCRSSGWLRTADGWGRRRECSGCKADGVEVHRWGFRSPALLSVSGPSSCQISALIPLPPGSHQLTYNPLLQPTPVPCYHGLNAKCLPRVPGFKHLVPRWWHCLGNLWNIPDMGSSWRTSDHSGRLLGL